MDTLVDDLAAVIDHLGLRDVVLIGHSMGGAEIIRYVARHGSAKVSKIVLLAPLTPFFMQAPDNPHGVPKPALEALRARYAVDFPGWVLENRDAYFAPGTPPQTMEWTLADMMQTMVPVLIACNRTLVETDLRPDLAKIDRPTLVIQGDADASAPLDITGRPTAAGIRGAVLRVIPGAPHGLYLSHVQPVNEAITAFLGRGA